jgi:hypothetical protein
VIKELWLFRQTGVWECWLRSKTSCCHSEKHCDPCRSEGEFFATGRSYSQSKPTWINESSIIKEILCSRGASGAKHLVYDGLSQVGDPNSSDGVAHTAQFKTSKYHFRQNIILFDLEFDVSNFQKKKNIPFSQKNVNTVWNPEVVDEECCQKKCMGFENCSFNLHLLFYDSKRQTLTSPRAAWKCDISPRISQTDSGDIFFTGTKKSPATFFLVNVKNVNEC